MRRVGRWLLALSLVAVLLAGVWFVTGFVRPTQPAAFDDGPVLVLGGDPSRAAVAAALVPDPSPDRPVWLSYSRAGWEAAGRSCDEPHVHCISPEPMSTWGETLAATELADEHGWEQLTVLTSAFHRTRSASLMERCLDVPVRVTGPPADGTVRWSLARDEAAATLLSAMIYRDC